MERFDANVDSTMDIAVATTPPPPTKAPSPTQRTSPPLTNKITSTESSSADDIGNFQAGQTQQPKGVFQTPLAGDDAPVRVVGFIGTDRRDHRSSITIANHIINKDAFPDMDDLEATDTGKTREFYDQENGILYVLLLCVFDDLETVASQAEVDVDTSERAHSDWISLHQESTMRNILFMFSSCHEIVVFQSSSRFESQWIRIFRSLEQERPNVNNACKFHGRLLPGLCVPNLFFLMTCSRLWERRALSRFTNSLASSSSGSEGAYEVLHKNIQRLQTALDIQIKRILKRARLVSSSERKDKNAARIFALEPRRPAVYVVSLNAGRAFGDVGQDSARLLLDLSNNEFDDRAMVVLATPIKSIKDLLPQAPHANRSLRGLETTLGLKDVERSKKEGVRLSLWRRHATQLYAVLVDTLPPCEDGDSLFDTIQMSSGGSNSLLAFSVRRCNKELPLAIDVYESKLPKHYREIDHTEALKMAIAYFTTAACGPALAMYRQRLEDECVLRWQNGRQLCENTSILGFSCILPLQFTDSETEQQTERVPVHHECSSGMKFVCACTCGKTNHAIEDPFVIERANHFHFSARCCSEVDRTSKKFGIVFGKVNDVPESLSDISKSTPAKDSPEDTLFQDKALAALLQSPVVEGTPQQDRNIHNDNLPSWRLSKLGASRNYVATKGLTGSKYIPGTAYLLPWNIPYQRQTAALIVKEVEDSSASILGDITKQQKQKDDVVDENKPKSVWRLPSLTADLAKNKSVWSGQQGVSADTPTSTPHVALNAITAYIGCEYECQQGCRFIHASPRKLADISDSGVVKDSASKTFEQEMPLYVHCEAQQCKKRRVVAQLARLHIVTPDPRTTLVLRPEVHFRKRALGAQQQRRTHIHESDEVARLDCVGGKLELDPDSAYVLQIPRVFNLKFAAAEYRHRMVLGAQWCFCKAP